MTARATAAANELHKRGWGVYDSVQVLCPKCGADSDKGARYCSSCGTFLGIADGDTLADLEAAIAAALEAT